MASPNFDAMHLRLVASLVDVDSSGNPITDPAVDGVKRSSIQRSRDLMDGRYFVHSVLRIADPEAYHTSQVDQVFSGTTALLDISSWNIIGRMRISANETAGVYNKPVEVIIGDDLPLYIYLLATSHSRELAIVNQGSTLRLLKGSSIPQGYDAMKFAFNYYYVPTLVELTAVASTDVTEPRMWWPLIESYALAMGFLGSANFQRSQAALVEANRLAVQIVQNEFGGAAAGRVQQQLQGAQA
jgi:hypothetical protein